MTTNEVRRKPGFVSFLKAVVTTGGRIAGEYARVAGTGIKALAPVRGSSMLDRTIDALRSAGVERIAIVAGDEARARCGARVDRVIAEADRGSKNVLLALGAWEDDGAPLLYCTSDMPYVTADALRDFIERAPTGAIAMPVAEYQAFVERFPGAPPYGITLHGTRVVNGGAFLFPAGSAPRIATVAAQFFDARKAPWRMAGLAGPMLLARFVIGRLSLAMIESRAAQVFGYPACAVRECAPELGYDADLLAEYAYANAQT